MDMIQLLEDRGVPYFTVDSGKSSRGWINLACPVCEGHRHLGYNLAGCFFSCWRCGYVPTITVLVTILGLDQHQAFELAKSLPRGEEVLSDVRKTGGKLSCPEGLDTLSPAHLHYLLDRGKQAKDVTRFNPRKLSYLWGLQGLSYLTEPRLRWRLFIPIMLQSKMVSWTTRSINGKNPKYLSASRNQSVVDPGDLVYGIDHCRHVCIVVEGPIDVWAVGPGAVALLGSHGASPGQLEQLCRLPVRVICFDAEWAAQQRARELMDDLSVFDGKTVNVVLKTGKDASRAARGELQELRKMLE
jgi:hypothetical protein